MAETHRNPLPNPLQRLHEQAEAEFQQYGRIEVVSTFGEPQAEYAALRKGCAMLDLPQRGVLELSGRDRLPFLNNLLTNETWNKAQKQGLAPGQGTYAFFLNLKGRIVTDMNVLETGERTLLEMDGRMVRPLIEAFEKYLFAEQVKLEDRTLSLHEIALLGPTAVGILSEVLEAPMGDLPPLGSTPGRLFGIDVLIWRDDPAGVPGYHILLPIESATSVWTGLIDHYPAAVDDRRRRLRPAGWAAFNATRIEAGRPIFGIDFDESILPAETGLLDRAVSFTKGCYLGQEIVARMHARGQLAKRLAGIRMEGDSLPLAGTQIFDRAGGEIGIITSSTLSPVLSNIAICLGYVKKPYFDSGSQVTIPAEGSLRTGTVVELPFIAAGH